MRSSLRFTRALISCGAIVLISSLLASCGGGGAPSMTPQTSGSSSQAEQSNNADATVDASEALAVSSDAGVDSRVLASTAHALPRQGEPLKLIAAMRAVPMVTYPKDLTNFGGPTMSTMHQYNLFVDCAASCWGSPGIFQANLNHSTMIHITDQYVGSTAAARYPVTGGVAITYTVSGTLQDSDIYAIVHAAAATRGTGYTKMYHVFLKQGVNECSTVAGGCYSPSNPATWVYCAYHGSVDFTDIGHTIYSVEPYQAVNGCEPNVAPNGLLIDSTASTLSHETFEAITDTDVAANNLAWYNFTYGEVGDECSRAEGVSTGTVTLNGRAYGIQKEYSNLSHACKYSK